MLVVIVGSLLPGKQKEAIGSFTPYRAAELGEIRWQHHAYHFIAFGGMALVLGFAARNHRSRLTGVALAAATGLSIEIAQQQMAQIGLEWWDVRDDLLACALALTLLTSARLRSALVRP